MSERGCFPVEVLSLLEFRDYDLVVRCLELVLQHVPRFAPEFQNWEIEVIPLCHHHPSNIYPALGIFDAGGADVKTMELFGKKADEWVRDQSLGWLLEASRSIAAKRWKDLCEPSAERSSDAG